MHNIAGFVPFTTIDYPGKLSAVVFFQGCPLRCPFCHNPNLQPLQGNNLQSWQNDVLPFLKTRTKQLDGVVLSGGEPLIQKNLPDIIQDLKALKFSIGLHTSGCNPNKLKEIISDIDWVGLDVKAPDYKYNQLTGVKNVFEGMQQTLKILTDNNINFEARTTLDPRHLTIDDIYHLAEFLHTQNVTHYTLQKYRTFEGDKNPPNTTEINAFFNDEKLITYLKKLFPHFQMR